MAGPYPHQINHLALPRNRLSEASATVCAFCRSHPVSEMRHLALWLCVGQNRAYAQPTGDPMKHFLFTLALAATQAHAADKLPFDSLLKEATPEQPICFGREYSEAHLKKAPAQKVKQIRVKLENTPDAGEGYSFLHVDAVLKGDKNRFKLWRQLFVCENSTGRCGVECDGGSVNLWGLKDGKLALQNNGFVLEGGCDGDGETETVMLEPTRGGDDLFQLSPLPNEFCTL